MFFSSIEVKEIIIRDEWNEFSPECSMFIIIDGNRSKLSYRMTILIRIVYKEVKEEVEYEHGLIYPLNHK